MSRSPFFSRKIALVILFGGVCACAVISVYSYAKPFIFPNARAKVGSYSDVAETKEINRLAVQRLLFSKVVTKKTPKTSTSLDECSFYIRRIMRGHVTTSLDFSAIAISNTISGKRFFTMPQLEPEAIIDEWVYYDSKGTGDKDAPKNATEGMDDEFRRALLDEITTNTNRIARAKEQAERIVKMLYPDEEFSPDSFNWPTNLIRFISTEEK